MKGILLILLSLFAVPGLAEGQTLPVNVETISIDDGLTDAFVYCITQDQLGYMWFGTKNGLNRFDGKNIKVYSYSNSSKSLSDSRVNSLLCCSDGKLLIGTARGIDIYDRCKDKIIPFAPAHEISSEVIRTMVQEDDILWVGTNNGLLSIDISNGKIVRFSSYNSGLVSNTVRAIHIDGNDIFVGTFNGLSRYDRAMRQWKTINLKAEYITNPKNNLILSIVESPYDSSKLFIGTQTGLCEFDKKKFTYELYEQSSHREIGNNTIKSMCVADSCLWLGTEEGLMVFKKGQFSKYSYRPNDKRSLPNNIIWSIFKDDRDILWIGTEGGVARFDMGLPSFSWTDLSKSKGNKFLDVALFTAQIDSKGIFWLGSRFGLCRYDPAKDAINWINFRDDSPGTYNFIRGLYLDRNDILWVGTAEGLVCYDTQTARKMYVNDHLENRLKYINSVCANGNDGVLVCDITGKIQLVGYVFDAERRSITITMEDFIALDNDVSSVVVGDKYIWAGTVGSGLMRYCKENGKIDSFQTSGTHKRISSDFITSVFIDNYGTLWCCNDKGVDRYDPVGDFFEPISIFSRLGYVYAANSDTDGNIWFVTRRNIVYLNPLTNKQYLFPTRNWIDLNNSAPSCIVSDKYGNTYIMAHDGYLRMNLNHIGYEPTPVPLLLSDIKIAGTSIVELGLNNNTPIENLSKLKIRYTQNSISFYFSLLDYSSLAQVRYEYKLSGYDSQWKELDGRTPFVEYSRLSAGRYRFHVRAVSSKGIAGGNTIDIEIVVKPSLWFSWWALALYTILVTAVLYIILSLQHRRKSIAKELITANIEKEKIEEINQLKLQFFTNISHDLRTPLSLILSPAESLMHRESNETKISKLKLIHQNATRLLVLVNQIIDFRKIENKKMSLDIKNADIVANLRRITFLFSDFSEKKDIMLVFESEEKSLTIDFDADKIEKIFINLISNAIQHSPAGGKIIVSLNRTDNDKIEIMVADDGNGITQSDLPHIFERFYQSSDNRNTGGSGIGLSIVKEFIELHDGKITVASTIDTGTTFFITLPIINEKKNLSTIGESVYVSELDRHECIDDALTTHRLLIIEDNEQMQQYLCDELGELYSVTGVASAEEGIKKIKEQLPDIIISDIMLPVMSGVELCSKIKNDIATSHIPVILLTAKTAEEHQIQGFHAGADAYITKPFSLKILFSRIDNILTQRQKYRETLKRGTIELAQVDIESPDKVFMDKVISIIEKNIDNPDLNLRDICNEMAISHISFYRKIKSITGFNPSGFIREIRLKKAAQLLQIKNISVSEVLYQVGFNHKSYFTICFKDRFGLTPREYVKKYSEH